MAVPTADSAECLVHLKSTLSIPRLLKTIDMSSTQEPASDEHGSDGHEVCTSIDVSELRQIRRGLIMKSIFAVWLVGTSAAFYRVSRQPFPARQKWEQYETIFKGTTLAAALAGIAVGSGTR